MAMSHLFQSLKYPGIAAILAASEAGETPALPGFGRVDHAAS
jgi:hypothetical protein